jgi:hypothetical protein
MIDDPVPERRSDTEFPFLDEILARAIPEVKLALGQLIDRENARALPGRYARLLPDTLLVVTFRQDAAEALAPVKDEVERELTDSCRRHGSLYDRSYRVELRRTEEPGSPLFRVSAHAGTRPEVPEEPASPEPAGSPAPPAALPPADPDATRVDGFGPPGAMPWEPGRWLLVVEAEGETREVFRLTEPMTTVGRQTGDPLLQTTVALRDVPHVSRRQLVLAWEPRDGAAGFRVVNVGLPPVRMPGQEIPGAHLGKDEPLRPDAVAAEHVGWLPPGVPLEIGDSGPVLRVDEVPEPAEDPDATVFE